MVLRASSLSLQRPQHPRRMTSARLASDSCAAAWSGSEAARRWFAELKAGPEPEFGGAGGPTATSLGVCGFSNPAGLMISIMRAGTSPAFHICVHFPAWLGDVPTASASMASRSPHRKPLSPSVTIEYSSSRGADVGRTSADREWVFHNRDLVVSN